MKRNNFSDSFLAFLLLFSLSCKSPTDIKIENQNGNENELIPTAIGNYWIYTDSAQTKFDTVSIVGKYDSLGYTLVELNNNCFAMEGIPNEFAVSTDAIYGWSSGESESRVPQKLYILPRDSTITINYIVGCFVFTRKATLYNRPITVPAGTFPKYVSYIEESASVLDSTVIVPGIGVVCRVLKLSNSTEMSFLKSYYFVN